MTALGILWNPEMDDLALRASTDEANSGAPTKRSVLAYIVRFGGLGCAGNHYG